MQNDWIVCSVHQGAILCLWVMFSVIDDPPIRCSTFSRRHALKVLEPTSPLFVIQVAMATAQVIFQRFYYSKSFVKYSIQVSDLVWSEMHITAHAVTWWWQRYYTKLHVTLLTCESNCSNGVIIPFLLAMSRVIETQGSLVVNQQAQCF